MKNTICTINKKLKLGHILAGSVSLAKQEAGTTIVESAFALIILIGITFGMADFGSIIYTRNAVESAAQEGAREGIMLDDDGTLRYVDIEEAVKDKLLLLDPSKADITINFVGGDTVEVEVQYPVKFVTPVGGLISVLSSSHDNWTKGFTVDAVAKMVVR